MLRLTTCNSRHILKYGRLTFARTILLNDPSVRNLHINIQLNQNRTKLTKSVDELEKTAKLQKQTQELDKNDAKFKKLVDDFSADDDHIHLRESETEKNDSFIPDATLHKQNLNSRIGQGIIKSHSHSHTQSHSHTHSHSHTESNPFLVTSLQEMKNNPGVRITWIGLGMNISIALGKFLGGIVFHSQALLADSVHALSDLISDILTLISQGWVKNKPNEQFPYGYGKVETVGSLAVSTILAMAGVSIGWSSLCAVVGPIIPHTILELFTTWSNHLHIHGSTHSHSHTGMVEGVTNINAAWIAGGSIVMKEWIFQATKKIAERDNSNVLMANAWHHRVDSLTSLVALVAITSSHFFGIQSLDSLGGILVSALVIKAGGEGMIGAMKELIDQSLPHDDERYIKLNDLMQESLNKLVSNNNSDIAYKVKELTVLLSGRNMRVNAVLVAPTQRWGNVLDVQELQNVATYIKNVVKQDMAQVARMDVEFVAEQDSAPSSGPSAAGGVPSRRGDASLDARQTPTEPAPQNAHAHSHLHEN